MHEKFSWGEIRRVWDAVEDEPGKVGGVKQEGRQGWGEDPYHDKRMQPRRVAFEEHVGEHKPRRSVSSVEVDGFDAGATDGHVVRRSCDRAPG